MPFIENKMVNPRRFYTYAYLRKDRTPYYIGKGSGKRIYEKRRRYCKPPKDKSRIIFLKQNLTEEEAFKHEKYMIAVFGRKDLGTGILHNRTDGGEGLSGFTHSEESKRKQSEKMKGENNPNYGKRGKDTSKYGKKHSEESKRRQSEKMKGENNPNYGKQLSIKTREKLSESNKGKIHSEETRKKLSKLNSGQNNPNYGKKGKDAPHYGKSHSDEFKRKHSERMKGENNPMYGKSEENSPRYKIPHSDETKRKIGDANRGENNASYGKKWWNNGQIEKREKECPGDGWVRGRIKKNKNK